MFVTYQVAASQAIRIVDRKVWRWHVASPWPEPREFAEYDGDVSVTKQWPLQPIDAYSWAQQPYHTAFAVVTENTVKWMELELQLELYVQFDDDVAAAVVIVDDDDDAVDDDGVEYQI